MVNPIEIIGWIILITFGLVIWYVIGKWTYNKKWAYRGKNMNERRLLIFMYPFLWIIIGLFVFVLIKLLYYIIFIM